MQIYYHILFINYCVIVGKLLCNSVSIIFPLSDNLFANVSDDLFKKSLPFTILSNASIDYALAYVFLYALSNN